MCTGVLNINLITHSVLPRADPAWHPHHVAVQSGEALIRSDGQLDKRSKAVRRGEVELKEGK